MTLNSRSSCSFKLINCSSSHFLFTSFLLPQSPFVQPHAMWFSSLTAWLPLASCIGTYGVEVQEGYSNKKSPSQRVATPRRSGPCKNLGKTWSKNLWNLGKNKRPGKQQTKEKENQVVCTSKHYSMYWLWLKQMALFPPHWHLIVEKTRAFGTFSPFFFTSNCWREWLWSPPENSHRRFLNTISQKHWVSENKPAHISYQIGFEFGHHGLFRQCERCFKPCSWSLSSKYQRIWYIDNSEKSIVNPWSEAVLGYETLAEFRPELRE